MNSNIRKWTLPLLVSIVVVLALIHLIVRDEASQSAQGQAPIDKPNGTGSSAQPSAPFIRIRQIRRVEKKECQFSEAEVDGNKDVTALLIVFDDVNRLLHFNAFKSAMAGISHVSPIRTEKGLFFLVRCPGAKYSLLIDNDNKLAELAEIQESNVKDYEPSGGLSRYREQAMYDIGVTHEHNKLELKINNKGSFSYRPWEENTWIGGAFFYDGYRFGMVEVLDRSTNVLRRTAVFDMDRDTIVSSVDYPLNFEGEFTFKVFDPSTDSGIVFSRYMKNVITLDLSKLVKPSDKEHGGKWTYPKKIELIRTP